MSDKKIRALGLANIEKYKAKLLREKNKLTIGKIKSQYDIPDDCVWISYGTTTKSKSYKIFDVNPHVNICDLLYHENGLNILILCLVGKYMQDDKLDVNFKFKDLLKGGKFCFVYNISSDKEFRKIEYLRKYILAKLPYEDIKLYLNATRWILKEHQGFKILFQDYNNELEKYLNHCFHDKLSTHKNEMVKNFTISRTPDLLFLNSNLSRKEPELDIPIQDDNKFIIKTSNHDYIFPLDVLKEKSEFFRKYTETKIGIKNNEYASEFSDEVIIYFQDYIYNKVYNYDKKLPWLRKNFDINNISELFGLLDYFQINDEVYGTELLKILYYYKDEIDNLREFITEISKSIRVPGDWKLYNEMVSNLINIS